MSGPAARSAFQGARLASDAGSLAAATAAAALSRPGIFHTWLARRAQSAGLRAQSISSSRLISALERPARAVRSFDHQLTRLMSHYAKRTNERMVGGPIGRLHSGRSVRQVAWLKEETKTILSIDTNIITTNYRIFLIPDELGRKWALHIKDVRESDRVSRRAICWSA